MRDLVLVFAGGGLGSIVRYSLGRWINSIHAHHFPFGTLIVNVSACFVLGLLVGLADHKEVLSPAMRLFWAVGFCGGFSTFSTFSHETLLLFQTGFNFSALVYIIASLALCIGATLAGIFAGENIL